MYTFFNSLPPELKHYEISKHLDKISKICLRSALCVKQIPKYLSQPEQAEVFNYSLSFIRFFYEQDLLDENTMYLYAAKAGNLEAMNWMNQMKIPWTTFVQPTNPISIQNYPWHQFIPDAAAHEGHLHILKWILDQGHQFTSYTCASAAHAGYFDLVKWIAQVDINVSSYAGFGGHLQIVEWAFQSTIHQKHFNYAALGGHLHILQYYETFGLNLSVNAASSAALNGHLPALKWLIQRNCPWDARACEYAAYNGHIHVLDYLWSLDPDIIKDSYYIADQAAWGGQVQVFEWMKEKHLKINIYPMILIKAAKSGSIECLKWLRDYGFSLAEHTATAAAEKGHLNTLKWLHANGAKLDKWTFSKSIDSNNPEILDWLLEQNCEYVDSYWPNLTLRPELLADVAAKNGWRRSEKWLIEHGFKSSSGTCATIARSNIF